MFLYKSTKLSCYPRMSSKCSIYSSIRIGLTLSLLIFRLIISYTKLLSKESRFCSRDMTNHFIIGYKKSINSIYSPAKIRCGHKKSLRPELSIRSLKLLSLDMSLIFLTEFKYRIIKRNLAIYFKIYCGIPDLECSFRNHTSPSLNPCTFYPIFPRDRFYRIYSNYIS